MGEREQLEELRARARMAELEGKARMAELEAKAALPQSEPTLFDKVKGYAQDLEEQRLAREGQMIKTFSFGLADPANLPLVGDRYKKAYKSSPINAGLGQLMGGYAGGVGAAKLAARGIGKIGLSGAKAAIARILADSGIGAAQTPDTPLIGAAVGAGAGVLGEGAGAWSAMRVREAAKAKAAIEAGKTPPEYNKMLDSAMATEDYLRGKYEAASKVIKDKLIDPSMASLENLLAPTSREYSPEQVGTLKAWVESLPDGAEKARGQELLQRLMGTQRGTRALDLGSNSSADAIQPGMDLSITRPGKPIPDPGTAYLDDAVQAELPLQVSYPGPKIDSGVRFGSEDVQMDFPLETLVGAKVSSPVRTPVPHIQPGLPIREASSVEAIPSARVYPDAGGQFQYEIPLRGQPVKEAINTAEALPGAVDNYQYGLPLTESFYDSSLPAIMQGKDALSIKQLADKFAKYKPGLMPDEAAMARASTAKSIADENRRWVHGTSKEASSALDDASFGIRVRDNVLQKIINKNTGPKTLQAAETVGQTKSFSPLRAVIERTDKKVGTNLIEMMDDIANQNRLRAIAQKQMALNAATPESPESMAIIQDMIALGVPQSNLQRAIKLPGIWNRSSQPLAKWMNGLSGSGARQGTINTTLQYGKPKDKK